MACKDGGCGSKKCNEPQFNYVLMLQNKDAYFANSLLGLLKEIITHRYNHWKRGDGWRD